jgi:hypothetical protein
MRESTSPERLQGEVHCNEVYVVAGHQGHPEAAQGQGRWGRCRRLQGERWHGILEKDKPAVVGLSERGGAVVIRMLGNVQRATIAPCNPYRPRTRRSSRAWLRMDSALVVLKSGTSNSELIWGA